MTTDQAARAGFAPNRGDRVQRRCTLLVHLIATAGLVLSLGVAGAAVSIGIARAVPAVTAQH